MRDHATSLSFVLQETSAKQQLCTYFTIFCSFLSVLTRLRRKKMPNFAFFMENVNQARRNYILVRVWIWSLGIQLQVFFRPHLTKLVSRNNLDKD